MTYNTLITACARGGRYNKALELFETLRKDGLTPDEVTYQTTIEVLEVSGQLKSAKDLFHSALRAGFFCGSLLTKDNQIDLHRLPVSLARVALSVAFDGVEKPCTIDVITGRGIHSPNQEPVLPQAMRDFVCEQGFRVEEVAGGAGLGMFRVVL